MNENEFWKIISEINWLDNIGDKLKGNVDFPYDYLMSHEGAMESIVEADWENITLERRNDITEFLHAKYKKEYGFWNDYADKARILIEENIIDKIEIMSIVIENPVIIDCIKWDVMNAHFEMKYSKYLRNRLFFHDLIEIYKNGNLPCGWSGDYNDGKLLIY